MKRLLTGLLVALVVAAPATAAPRPYSAFLRDVVDLERLAVLPEEGATCKQFSSYDRASRIGDDGTLLDWSANGDAGQFLRQDPEGHVLAEMDGPGCIVRIWSANPMGTLKVYIDGATQPTFQADFAALTAGKFPGIPVPIVGVRALGANCYLPMPYQKHCKVVVENPGSLYYHVNYWTYPAGTEVEPFRWPLTAAQQAMLKAVCRRMEQCGAPPAGKPRMTGAVTHWEGPEPRPREETVVTDIGSTRGGAITAIRIRPTLPEDRDAARKALHSLWLSITFDGAKSPQVLAPLDHFFGTAPGLTPYRSLPLGITDDGTCYSYWYMPYARNAVIKVIGREGGPRVPFTWEVYAEDQLRRPFSRLMHFHARYRQEYPNRVFDWPFLEATGRGRFVGAALSIWNPVKGWWGEGDEKVWVDGEKFPSWFGTGSEDYFGYAWCSNQPFTHALHNQPLCEGPGNANYTAVNRWHLADNIPFQKSFRMTIENYGQDKDYASVAYWYQAPGGTHFFTDDTPDRELHQPLPEYRIPGALEGENLRILAKEIAAVDPQDMGGFGGQWSGETHLWLRPAKVGEWVDLALPVEEAGRYEVVVYLTKAIDYGIAQFRLNGQVIGQPYDAFNDGVIPTGPVSLGIVELAPGEATLRVEVIGKNEKSVGLMAGLDAVVLKKQ
ncbi:MAG: DUF2961 domain-containing protein [Armatimonadetes bacterium]|jgi:hypothetical protein|nr:DUF2961 domain-containing protein [Armatimonadota bacterium]